MVARPTDRQIYIQWVCNHQICNFLIQPVIVSLYFIIAIYYLITIDNSLHYSYLLKRNQGNYFPAFKFLSIHHKLLYQVYYFLFNSILQEDNHLFSTKTTLKSRTIRFPQSDIQQDYYQFSSKKSKTQKWDNIFLLQKIPSVISIKKRITFSTRDMSKSQSIYIYGRMLTWSSK